MSTERRLSIEGHTLVALEYNADTNSLPVICLHGVAGNIGFFEDFLTPAIQQDFHWYSLTLPGHYPAVIPAEHQPQDINADTLARIMSTAIRQLTGGKPALLIGYSTGGFVAYCVAHHAPELVHSIISIDGFAHGKWHGILGVLQAIARLPYPFFYLYMKPFYSSKALYRLSYLSLGHNQVAIKQNPVFEQAVDHSYPYSANADFKGLYAYFRNMPNVDIRRWLKGIKQPAFLIHGRQDDIVKPEHAQEIQNALPNCHIRWIEGAGHLLMLERPDECQDALAEAVERLTHYRD